MRLVLGIILLAVPFLLLAGFKDKKLGFAKILSFVLVLQLSIAVFTQSLRLFTYSTVLALNFIVFLVVLGIFYRNRLFKRVALDLKKTDWILIFVIIVSFLHLYRVHYNYSGKYSTFRARDTQAEHMVYPYPYYSDEWDAVSFIKYSIDSRELPIVNPLSSHKSLFRNLELAFHSFLSEIVLLLDLNPLIDYTKISLAVGALTIILVYLLLRVNEVNRLSAAIASLSALYITNGASLPGIWYLLPLNVGIIFLLLGFIFISKERLKMAIFVGFITLLFYPPLVVFYLPAFVVFLIASKKISKRQKLKALFVFSFIVFAAAAAVSFFYFLSKGRLEKFYDYILFSKLIHPTFAPDSIPNYPIANIIPTHILLLSAVGIFVLLKRKSWLVLSIIIGLVHWFLYSEVSFRLIIEYERVIFSTSILLVIVAGFGLNYLVDVVGVFGLFRKENMVNYIQAGVLLLFLALSFGYTKQEGWQKLTLTNFKTGRTLLPEAPANKHLHPDDIELFRNIKEKRFLSLPWKGKVVGVATDNYPLLTKAGTISVTLVPLSKFMQGDCSVKRKMAKNRHIEYLYLPEFFCPGFEFVGKSSEALYLYEFEGQKD